MSKLPRPGPALFALLALGLPPFGPVALSGLAQTQTPAQAPAQAPTPAAPPSEPPAPEPSAPETAQPEGPGTPESAPPAEPGAEPGEATNEQSSLELVRVGDDGQERRIRVVRTGTSDETGIFTICAPLEGDPEGAPNLAVFSESGPGGVQITIDKNVIRVPYALVTQRPVAEGQEGSDGRVEASAGTARFLDEAPEGATDRLARCGVATEPRTVPDTVLVTQGRTELRGQKLVYDEADGIARVEGPITFKRDDQADPLSGKSDRIDVSVDDEKLVLVGNVTLISAGGRVSKAARAEYDDEKNEARLYGTPGQPAESVRGKERFVAGLIVYDLERNEVYSTKPEGGTITGEFPDEETPEAPAPATPANPAVPTPPNDAAK